MTILARTTPASMPAQPARFAPPSVQNVLGSAGRPLDSSTRAFMEPRFGHDFGQVRVHTDARAAASARAVNALAYTVGQEVVFGAGRYAPQTGEGRRLLAHELTHVVQQAGVPRPAHIALDDSHEQAAQSAATAVAGGARYSDVNPARNQALAREVPDYEGTKKQMLEELARNMPVAILGMLDGLDRATRTKLSADPEINQAIEKLPPGARVIVLKHLNAAPAQPLAAVADTPLTRAQFDQIMKNRYRVTTIRNGTFQDQSFGDMREAEWKPWNPPATSMVYNWIIQAFVDIEKTFGGLPEVKEIVFFDMHYETKNGHVVKDTETGASYQSGQMMIYSAVQTGSKMFNKQGVLERPSVEQAVRRNIAHELGHGIGETALTQSTQGPLGADVNLFKEFNPAVGWAKDLKLYDIQEPAVKAAIAKDAVPPAQYQITPDNFDTKSWKEQPLTAYAATNSMEDFGETIMAYVYQPEALKKHSPARFKFVEDHKARWIASGHPKVDGSEQGKDSRPVRVLKPSEPVK